MNDGRIDVLRMTIATQQDVAVLLDPDSANVLCDATCLIVEFSGSEAGSNSVYTNENANTINGDNIVGDNSSGGRAAFEKLLEHSCRPSFALAQPYAMQRVKQSGNFEAACKRHLVGTRGTITSTSITQTNESVVDKQRDESMLRGGGSMDLIESFDSIDEPR